MALLFDDLRYECFVIALLIAFLVAIAVTPIVKAIAFRS